MTDRDKELVIAALQYQISESDTGDNTDEINELKALLKRISVEE